MARTIDEMKKYQLISILDMSHFLMDYVISPQCLAVDMTLGNGHDTAYLAQRCQHVYAFDISASAIRQAKQHLATYDNVTIFHASHEDFDSYLPASSLFDLFVFNLGYLPGSDKSMPTQANTTIATLSKLFAWMKPGSSILVVCYVGHEGGNEEYEAIVLFCEAIVKETEIIRYEFLQAPKSPKIIMIHKLRREC